MPAYVMLTRITGKSLRELRVDPSRLLELRKTLERWEANVLADYRLLGQYDHCIVFEISDNFRAQRAVLHEEIINADDTILLPGINFELFERLVRQEIRTVGPHEWQIKWWAKFIRLSFRWYQYDRWIRRYCKPLTVTGLENFTHVSSPCIVIGNHTSHFDTLVLFSCLPARIKWNIYFGAAADRWFLKDGGGRSELNLQPWYNSMVSGLFPIRRGGGAASLDYSKWLLDQGANLGIFPEGTRSTGRKMARFRHGVAVLAVEKKVPVMPVYLAGLSKIRPKGSRKVFPGPVSAHIQPPIYLPDDITVPEATRLIYHRMNEVHNRVLEFGPEAGQWNWQ